MTHPHLVQVASAFLTLVHTRCTRLSLEVSCSLLVLAHCTTRRLHATARSCWGGCARHAHVHVFCFLKLTLSEVSDVLFFHQERSVAKRAHSKMEKGGKNKHRAQCSEDIFRLISSLLLSMK